MSLTDLKEHFVSFAKVLPPGEFKKSMEFFQLINDVIRHLLDPLNSDTQMDNSKKTIMINFLEMISTDYRNNPSAAYEYYTRDICPPEDIAASVKTEAMDVGQFPFKKEPYMINPYDESSDDDDDSDICFLESFDEPEPETVTTTKKPPPQVATVTPTFSASFCRLVSAEPLQPKLKVKAFVQCEVCLRTQVRTQRTFGVTVCSTCCHFFRRHNTENLKLTCVKSGSCSTVAEADTNNNNQPRFKISCNACHLQRCIQLGMVQNRTSSGVPCAICADSPSSLHYGVYSCYNCFLYYNRIKRNAVKSSGQCDFNRNCDISCTYSKNLFCKKCFFDKFQELANKTRISN